MNDTGCISFSAHLLALQEHLARVAPQEHVDE